MSATVDTNILVYASDRRSSQHTRAVELVTSLVSGRSLVYLLWPVIMGYLRIATNSRIFPEPLTPKEATANIADLLRAPHIRTVSESADFFEAYSAISSRVSPRGKLVPDAHIVSLMHQHGIDTIWSGDRDFRKFDGIEVRNPF